MDPRRYQVEINYNGVEATAEIEPYLESFTYTDSIDESDTIAVSLKDRDGKWTEAWSPQKGDQIIPEIGLYNWTAQAERRTIICGSHTVDDFTFSGPPDQVAINGISSPLDTDFKEMSRSKTWKDVTLYQIEREIADRYGLECVFDGTDVPIAKLEQSRQPDAEFLRQTAEKYGFGVKTYSGKIVLLEYARYEAKEVRGTIKKQDVIRWSCHGTTLGTYTGAKVSYLDPKTKETTEILVGTEGRLYNTTEKADSLADAERIGKNAIRKANRNETTMTLTVPQVFGYNVADLIHLEGFGRLDGIYQISKISHQIRRKDYQVQVSGWRVRTEGTASAGPAQTNEAQPSSGTYTVIEGDTLWELAKQFYGDATRYELIYEANREVIEQEASRRGKSSSSGGYWIFPGTILTIPEVQDG